MVVASAYASSACITAAHCACVVENERSPTLAIETDTGLRG